MTNARRLATPSGLYAYGVDEAILDRSPMTGVVRPRVGQDTTSPGLARDEVDRLLIQLTNENLSGRRRGFL